MKKAKAFKDQFTIRFTQEEIERVNLAFKVAQDRERYVTQTAFLKELLSLIPQEATRSSDRDLLLGAARGPTPIKRSGI